MEIENEYAKISQNKGGAEPADDYHFSMEPAIYTGCFNKVLRTIFRHLGVS